MLWRILTIQLLVISSSGMAQSNLIVEEFFYRETPRSRGTFQYDAQGREVGSKYYSYVGPGEWGLYLSIEKRFDNAGNVIFFSNTHWKYSDDSAYYHTETNTLYNDAGKIAEETTSFHYDISGPQEQKYKTGKVYLYNELGCLTTILNRTYFEEGGYYETSDTNETDATCRPLKRTYGGNYVTIWNYESSNSYTERGYSIENGDSTLRAEKSYVNNLVTEVIYPGGERTNYAYNQQGKTTEIKRFRWVNSIWVMNELTTNTYNELGQLISQYVVSGPDVVSEPPLYTSHHTYEYNEFGSVKYSESDLIDTNGIYSYKGGSTTTFRCDGKPLTWVSIDLNDGTETYRTAYYYSSSAPCEEPSANISLFPNPTFRFLKINSKEPLQNAILKIYNTSGQLLSVINDTKKMTPIELDLVDFIPGIYVLKVESNGMVISERFVKK